MIAVRSLSTRAPVIGANFSSLSRSLVHSPSHSQLTRLGVFVRSVSTRAPAVGARNLLFPWLGLEAQVPAAQLRERMSEFASQASLCYALLGGISAAALLSADANQSRARQPSAISEQTEQYFGKGWAERCGPPLWCASVCDTSDAANVTTLFAQV